MYSNLLVYTSSQHAKTIAAIRTICHNKNGNVAPLVTTSNGPDVGACGLGRPAADLSRMTWEASNTTPVFYKHIKK